MDLWVVIEHLPSALISAGYELGAQWILGAQMGFY